MVLSELDFQGVQCKKHKQVHLKDAEAPVQTKNKRPHTHSVSVFRLQVFCLGGCSILRMTTGSEKRLGGGVSWLREQVGDLLGFDRTFPMLRFIFLI